MIAWVRRQRAARLRAELKAARYAEMAPLALQVRRNTIAALAASSDVAVLQHLLSAVDHIDQALRILAPDVTPPEIFDIALKGRQ